MGCSPVPAVNNLLKQVGRSSASEYDRVELNEAFAAQYLACERELGLKRENTNVNGACAKRKKKKLKFRPLFWN